MDIIIFIFYKICSLNKNQFCYVLFIKICGTIKHLYKIVIFYNSKTEATTTRKRSRCRRGKTENSITSWKEERKK